MGQEAAPPRRVLHIGKYYPPCAGGIETYLRDLMIAQARRGDHPAAIVHHPTAWTGCRKTTIEGLDVWQVSTLGRLLYTPISLSFGWRLEQAITRHQPEVLHFHVPNVSAFWALVSPRARRLPWIVQWQSDVVASRIDKRLALAYGFYRPWERRLLKRAAAVIVASPPYLESSFPLAAFRSKCHVVPLGIDLDRLPMPVPALVDWAEKTWRPDLLRVLLIGRLTYYKGHDVLLRAVPDLPEAQLCLVGQGDLEHVLRARIAELGIVGRVQLLGGLDDAHLHAMLATCDVLCLPSIERTEAFGLVLLEAMRYARPIVASDIPGSGPGWIVREGETGLLTPPGDAPRLAEAINLLGREPALREKLGRAGAVRLAEQFNLDRIAEQTAEIYRDCVTSM